MAMDFCVCGETAEDASGRCSRCAALQVLGLEAKATGEEIRAAHRLLVQVWHPDRFQANAKLKAAAEEKLKAINRAHNFLTSRVGRKMGRGGASQSAARAAKGKPQESRGQTARKHEGFPRGARTGWRGLKLLVTSTPLLLTCTTLAGLAILSALFLKPIDSFLASNPETARFYGELRAETRANIEGVGQRIRNGFADSSDRLMPA
jgi:curved DNA-binding protein CbpA